VVPLEKATGEVQNSLRGRPRERTDVIDVSYVAADPILAQQVVDRAVEVFQTLSASTAKQESMLRRQFVEQQLQKVEGMLADAQAVHNRFRSREKVYSSQEKFRAQQADLTSIEMRRQELNADREMYVSLLEKLNENKGTGPISARVSTLVASPGIASNQVVAQLFGRLLQLEASRDSLTSGSWGRAQANPDVQRLDTLIRSTQTRVVEAVRAQVAATDARLSALDNMRKTVAGELSTLPNTEAEETSLVAQVDAYNDEAKRLRQELQTAQIAEAAEAGQVEIVDLALPGEPIGSGRKPKFVIALLIGLGLGATVAYVLENYRPIIRRRDELEQMIAFPNLALIPRIDLSNGRANGVLGGRLNPRGLAASVFGNGNGHANGNSNGRSNGHAPIEAGVLSQPLLGTELVTVSETRSSSAEAYRTLRTNLLFSAAVRTLARVVVTSPGPTEGKSTTAANLAISFAQQGHRVLLMDCDLRRSRIHKMFGVPQMPGVTNVLLGNISIEQAVRETAVDQLFILPSGPLPPNPAELLGSERMKATLDGLANSYDIVIIDSPPLLAASDAAILTRHADGALVVVRAGKTERSALQTAIQQLATVGARVLGTVLNDPDAEVPKYARYYSYYYNNYYE
jgi:capsular exopolysaccharide synthesis family protein